MTSQNIFTFDGYVCYHATGETNNQYYRNVGLLNIKDKIVVSATYNGIAGRLQSNAPYFEFNGQHTYLKILKLLERYPPFFSTCAITWNIVIFCEYLSVKFKQIACKFKVSTFRVLEIAR